MHKTKMCTCCSHNIIILLLLAADYTKRDDDVIFTSTTTGQLCINISVEDDMIIEGTETFSISFSARNSEIRFNNNMADVTLRDDDGE